MPSFIIGFLLGRWAVLLLAFMVAHPIRFLIGLVRLALVFAALVVGILGPLLFGAGGWAWVAMPILVALLLLAAQSGLRSLSDRM